MLQLKMHVLLSPPPVPQRMRRDRKQLYHNFQREKA